MNQRLFNRIANGLSHLSFKWVGPLILLFAVTQTAGLVHAEIHPFHEHTASCDLFDHLAQPIDDVATYTPNLLPPVHSRSKNDALISVAQSVYQQSFQSRAPPFA
jgi:hypothetical protein